VIEKYVYIMEMIAIWIYFTRCMSHWCNDSSKQST